MYVCCVGLYLHVNEHECTVLLLLSVIADLLCYLRCLVSYVVVMMASVVD